MRVIGTAGHVDHGKSTLIKRLTGIDPDRLAEEKAREMTIDLGFAWFNLPDGDVIVVVDVPGHRDFIENMLAGVGGIDAVLLIIAADEGIMPQTREHLAILDLIGVERGIAVLTKTDLIDDPEWLDLIELDVHDVLQPTRLHDAPIVRVSAHNNTGIDTLLSTLDALLETTPARRDIAQPRLPIDRVFVLSGFGTVVTGTLLDGTLQVGQDVQLHPDSRLARIRGLQSYKQKVDIAHPGSRVAVNLAGIDKEDISRGNVLTLPDTLQATHLIDVFYEHLPDATASLKHNMQVKVFSGTTETTAHVRLLNDDSLKSGQSGWLQLRLADAITVARNDRFILRYPSPPQTIGGGVIVDPHPARRWKRFQEKVISRLETQLQGTPAERLAQIADNDTPTKIVHLMQASGYNQAEFDRALDKAITQGLLVDFGEHGVLAMHRYRALHNTIHALISDYHQQFPLRLGIQREEVRSRLGLKNNLFSTLIEREPDIIAEANLLRLNTHTIQFNDQQQAKIDQLFAEFDTSPYTPPSYSDAMQITGKDVLIALIDLDEIVQIQPEIIFRKHHFEDIVAGTLHLIEAHDAVTAKMVRDHFETSRKYAIGMLEYLDSVGITKRVGDERIKGKNAPQ